MPYRHTQIGYIMVAVLGAAVYAAAAANSFIIVCILSASAILFSTLSVFVDSESVSFWFGLGFMPKQFPIIEIESCQIAKSRSWHWGVYGRPGKWWSFSVFGSRSVQLKMRNGMKYYIGTDQPEALEKAILEAMHAARFRFLKTE